MRTQVLPLQQFCTGCGACTTVCAKSAITMQPDAEGFLYPVVDSTFCVGCDQCEKRCPTNQKSILNQPKVFSAWNTKEEERAVSSSGGIFTVLARETLHMGGAVFGAVFDSDFHVEHVGAITSQEIGAMRGSKYVQSDATESLRHAADLVRKEVPVLFSGTPCQIAGLYMLLEWERPTNLTTVDFICHGVPSPAVFRSYLEELKRIFRAPIESYTFRDKQKGWRNFSVVTHFKNQAVYTGTQREDPFLVGFLANLYLRPSCHTCTNLRHGNHVSDLTLGDLWGAEKVISEKDDDKGLSLIFANTDKGRNLLSSLSGVKMDAIGDLKPLYSSNPSIISPAAAHENRQVFFKGFAKHGFKSHDVLRLVKQKKDPITRIKRKLLYLFSRKQ